MGQHHAWTQEPSQLQFIASQRVRHNWSDLACMYKQDSIWTKLAVTLPLLDWSSQTTGQAVGISVKPEICQNLFLEMLHDPDPWHLSPQYKCTFRITPAKRVDVLSHGPFDTGSKRQEWGWQEIKSYVIASALFTLKFNIFIELKAGYCTHPIKELSIYREVSCVLNHKTQFLFIYLHSLNTKWIIMWYPSVLPRLLLNLIVSNQ